MMNHLWARLSCIGLLSLSAAIGVACSADSQSSGGCRSDADCYSDEVCRSAQCVKIGAGGQSPGTGGTASSAGGTVANGGIGNGGISNGTGGTSTSGGNSSTTGGSAATGGATSSLCRGAVGSPTAGHSCGCNDDCDPGEFCIDEGSIGIAGGICAGNCTPTSCPSGTVCEELTPGDPSTALCLVSCALTTDCDKGQVCQTTRSGGPLICYPLCQADSDCPVLGECDRQTNFCGPPAPGESLLADVGAPCTSDSQCQSSFCIPPSSLFPQGYCTAFCSLSLQGCPAGSHCTANWSNVGDQGICFSTCSVSTDCRNGYQCGKYTGDPTLVCAPK